MGLLRLDGPRIPPHMGPPPSPSVENLVLEHLDVDI